MRSKKCRHAKQACRSGARAFRQRKMKAAASQYASSTRLMHPNPESSYASDPSERGYFFEPQAPPKIFAGQPPRSQRRDDDLTGAGEHRTAPDRYAPDDHAELRKNPVSRRAMGRGVVQRSPLLQTASRMS